MSGEEDEVVDGEVVDDDAPVTTDDRQVRDDLVIIAVAKEEERLTVEKMKLKATVQQADRDIKRTNKELEASARQLVDTAVKDQVTALNAALEALDFSVRVHDYSFHVDKEEKEVVYCIELAREQQNQRNAYHDHATRVGSKEKKLALQDEQNALITSVTELEGQRQAESERLVDVTRKLSQISMLERRAKAFVAESHLEQTEEGAIVIE